MITTKNIIYILYFILLKILKMIDIKNYNLKIKNIIKLIITKYSVLYIYIKIAKYNFIINFLKYHSIILMLTNDNFDLNNK